MNELLSRKYCSKDNEITFFFKNPPDKDVGFAGYVTGSGLPDEVILCVDPRPNDKHGYDFAGIVKSGRLGKTAIFMEDAIFMEAVENSLFAMFVLFHELGHYIFDPSEKELSVKKRYDTEREKCVDAGLVIDEEKAADEIAAEYLGIDGAIEGLKRILEENGKRAATGLYDLESVEKSMKEIRLRILNLRNKMNSTE